MLLSSHDSVMDKDHAKQSEKKNQAKSLQTYLSEQSLQKPIPMHKQRNVSK